MVEQDGVTPDLKLHSTDEQLELYALGRISDPDRVVLEEHLMVCESCRGRLDGIGSFAFGMQAAGIESMAKKEKAIPSLMETVRPLLRRPAVSMSLAFLLLLVVLGIFSIGKNEVPAVATLQLTATRGAMPVTVPARSYDLRLTDAPRDGAPGESWSSKAQDLRPRSICRHPISSICELRQLRRLQPCWCVISTGEEPLRISLAPISSCRRSTGA